MLGWRVTNEVTGDGRMLDAKALTTDAAGLAFLADALGTTGETERPGRAFPADAWMPRPAARLEAQVPVEDVLQAELA